MNPCWVFNHAAGKRRFWKVDGRASEPTGNGRKPPLQDRLSENAVRRNRSRNTHPNTGGTAISTAYATNSPARPDGVGFSNQITTNQVRNTSTGKPSNIVTTFTAGLARTR